MSTEETTRLVDEARKRQSTTSVSRSDVEARLASLARLLGLAKLELDQTGTVTLTIDDEIEIALTHLPERPYLIATAAMPSSPGSRGELLRKLLSSNLDMSRTQGGTFAIIPQTGALVFCAQIDISEGGAAALDRGLGKFVELAEAWQVEIADFIEAAENDAGAPFTAPPVAAPGQFV